VSFSATRGEPCTLKVELQSVGTENALGFSLGFDPALLQFVELRPIAIPVGAGFLVNSLQAGQGELGVLMALSPGSTLSATNRILLEVDFLATPGADPARTTISFTDAPVRREVASVTAKALPAVFEDAADVTLIPENWDPAPPVATLASTAPNPARVAPVPVSVTFSKNVMGFTAQGIVTGNARVENVSGSGRAYTFDLYPINRGRLTAAIPAGAATDYLGTPNLASTTFSCRFGAAAGDADGDGRADLLVYDPSSGLWYVRGANGAVVSWGQAWGGAGFTPVSGDYDGDLVSDLAVYDRASASWFIRSVAGQMLAWGVAWGGLGFEPVSGDYDGDLISDLAVFAPDGGLWYALDIGGQVLLWAEPWGAAGMVAVPGDYDGDGRADLAVYHEGSGAWYVKSSASGTVLAWADTWGGPGFAPVAGDFDGDGRADQAVYQRSAGAWYVKTLGGTVVFWAEGWGGQGLMPCSE
jgi:hypothetical protein